MPQVTLMLYNVPDDPPATLTVTAWLAAAVWPAISTAPELRPALLIVSADVVCSTTVGVPVSSSPDRSSSAKLTAPASVSFGLFLGSSLALIVSGSDPPAPFRVEC